MKPNEEYVVLKVPVEHQDENEEKKKNKRVCEVCGHVNEEDSLMCSMCSNYLED